MHSVLQGFSAFSVAKENIMRKRTQAREASLKILYAADITGSSVQECHRNFWGDGREEKSEMKKFSDCIVFGFDSKRERVDEVIAKYAANWKISRMASIDRNVLRIAVFELLFVEEVPPKVVINEAIEMAKKYGDTDSGKFVNGILDRICKAERSDTSHGL